MLYYTKHQVTRGCELGDLLYKNDLVRLRSLQKHNVLWAIADKHNCVPYKFALFFSQYWSSDIATKDNTAYGAARLGESAQYEEIDISIGGVRTTSNKAYSVVQHSSPIEDAYESVTEANTDGTAGNLDYEN